MPSKLAGSFIWRYISMFLSPSELRELTGKRTKAAQARVLNAMGIKHIIRPDGSAAVLRSHVEKQLDYSLANAINKEVEPDWEAV